MVAKQPVPLLPSTQSLPIKSKQTTLFSCINTVIMNERPLKRSVAQEDLYSGFDETDPLLDTRGLEHDEGFQTSVQLKTSSYGRRPGTMLSSSGRLGTAAMRNRLSTAQQPPSTAAARPLTAVRGAGFVPTKPSNLQAVVPTVTIKLVDENSPFERIKILEKEIDDLLVQSTRDAKRNQQRSALDQAKLASSKQKQLSKLIEQHNPDAPHHIELVYCVQLNLATQYSNNEMYSEAMDVYQSIVQNRSFSNVGRLKMNMGNVCFKQGLYAKAIKYFRMALDQVPNTQKDLRIKVMKNIGVTFLRMGEYVDAIASFEYIMAEKSDSTAALNLLLCHYALDERPKLKRTFIKLLDIAPEDEEDVSTFDSFNDALLKLQQQRKRKFASGVLNAALLITPLIGSTYAEGYDWCLEQIKASPYYSQLTTELEMSKVVAFLKKRDFAQAIEALKMFEKRDTKVASIASTNLSFLYLHDDLTQAEYYADRAIEADKYNVQAIVNKGNCCYKQGMFAKAKDYYQEAIAIETDCIEAIYNLALVQEKLGANDLGLECLLKCHSILASYPLTLFQTAATHQKLKNYETALEYYQQTTPLVTDSGMFSQIAEILEKLGDEPQAFHFMTEAYRYNPSDLTVLKWLAERHLSQEDYDEALRYFKDASLIQPSNPHWQLQVAACFLKTGNYVEALNLYKAIHRKFPDDVECLQALVKLSGDMGLTETSSYSKKLKSAERLRQKSRGSADNRTHSGVRMLNSNTPVVEESEDQEIVQNQLFRNAPAQRPMTAAGNRVDLNLELDDDMLPI